MRKITILLIVVLTTALFAGEYPKVDIHGRFLLEMDRENNMTDWTKFKDNNFNDMTTFTTGRLDLNFDTAISENIMVKIHARAEGDGGSKWIMFNSDSGNKLKDAKFRIQQAYVQYDNLFIEGLSAHFGQKLWNYGGGNILGPADYVGGAALMFKRDNMWVDFQTINMDEFENAEYPNIEEDHAEKIFGVIGGLNKIADMTDFHAYFFRRGENVEVANHKTECDAVNVFGARTDMTLMDGMVKPYFEFAMQMGANDAVKIDYSGMLIDAGVKGDMDLGTMSVMPRFEFFYRTGDDVSTVDEIETFTGIGMGNVEVGYDAFNIHDTGDTGLMMINVGSDFVPAMCKKLTVGFDFWMFNDNTKEWKVGGKDMSGENMYNEINLTASFDVHEKACLYTGWGIYMPNKDYVDGEDSATALWFGTEVKW